MKKINNITIKVVYSVGLSELEVPDNIAEQLTKAFDKGIELEPDLNYKEYNEAMEWLNDNINEGDAMDWLWEIEDLEVS